MAAPGLRLDSRAPPLLVDFNAALSDKLRLTRVPATTGTGFGGCRSGLDAAWPKYIDQMVVTQHEAATLNIDIVDTARQQRIWESVVSDNVTQKQLYNVQATIDGAVAAAFAKHPAAAAAATR